jgi:hypothetical protein
MGKWRQVLERWSFPHTVVGGITLVNCEDAERCLSRVYAEASYFHGYDAAQRWPDGKYSLSLEHSDHWPTDRRPSLNSLLATIAQHPPEVTHYEFVFGDDV